MESRQLRYFLAICDEGTFSAAARRLGIAQPPLSAQIKAFEQSLGVRLFDRSHRRADLTAAGSQLLPEAREIIQRMVNCEVALWDAAAGRSGTVAIGVGDGVRSESFTKRLRKFARSHRGVRLAVSFVGDDAPPGSDCLELHDIVVTGAVSGTSAGEGQVFESVDLGLALPRKHRLIGRTDATAADVAGETIVLSSTDRTSSIDRAIRSALTGDGFTFDNASARTLEQRLWSVALGLGLTVCAQADAQESRWRLPWIPLEPALPRWETRLVAGSNCRDAVVSLMIDELCAR